MIPHSITKLVPWIMAHGYLLIFIASMAESSLVMIASGVVVGLGFFNIFLMILILISGDFLGDIAYYSIGYSSKKLLHGKLNKLPRLAPAVQTKIKKIVYSHPRKAIFFTKFSPLIGPAGLVYLGSIPLPFYKFLKAGILVSITKGILFTLIGYTFAQNYLYLSNQIGSKRNLAIIIIVLFILMHFFYKKLTKKYFNQI